MNRIAPTPVSPRSGELAEAHRLGVLDATGILDTVPEKGFDDIVHLARMVCGTPVALVSFVASDRQWFKAKVGFEPCQTPLEQSVCKHVIGEPDLLIIPDLTQDPRTRANPLVTDAPFIRFYAGAPLETSGGTRLGSLCVIDVAPRPHGLTADQADALRGLAGQVMAQMELRQALTDRDGLLDQLRVDGRFMRSVLASSADCIKVLDLDTRLTFMSEGGMRVMEVGDFNAIKGCPWPDFWQDQGNRDAHAAVAAAKAGGIGHFQGEANTFAGTPKWWDVQVTPILDADGKPEKLLSVSRDITVQKRSEAGLAFSEARWRGLFENMNQGFFVGELVRDVGGRPVDYRYLEINPAFARQSGLPPDSIGRTIRSFVPDIDQSLIDRYAGVVDTGEPTLFEIDVPGLSRCFEVRANRDGGQRFACLFLDVTARKSAERRQAALIELGDRLRDIKDKVEIATVAAEVAAVTLDLDRAGYGSVDQDRETILVDRDWFRPGLSSVGGLHHFRDYGSFIEAHLRGETVVIDDVTTDPRTSAGGTAFTRIGAKTVVNIPLMEGGRLVGLFFMLAGAPRAWTVEEVGFLRNLADRTRAAIARVEAEERQDLLNHELSHRMKNLLAMVQAIAVQTTRGATDVETVREKLGQRLIALGKAHDLLLGGAVDRADFEAVIRGGLGVHDDAESGRFDLSGPVVDISGDAALALSLMLHELSTNAAKYGALSVPDGRVAVDWSVSDIDGEPTVRLTWRESGGPEVTVPSRKGFGSRLIERGLTGQVGGTMRLDYAPAGVTCEVEAPLRGFQKEAP